MLPLCCLAGLGVHDLRWRRHRSVAVLARRRMEQMRSVVDRTVCGTRSAATAGGCIHVLRRCRCGRQQRRSVVRRHLGAGRLAE